MRHTLEKRNNTRFVALFCAFALLISIGACSKDNTTLVGDTVTPDTVTTTDTVSGDITSTTGELLQSSKNRVTDPNVSSADLKALTDGNNGFAWTLYKKLSGEPGNLFFSPHSISTALAMTYAGANGTTKSEMAATLHYTLADDKLHPAFNALDLALQKRGEGKRGSDGGKFQLNVVNALWGAKNATFLDSFLDGLALNYGAGLRILDFVGDTEGSRKKINDWVASNTGDRIQDLIPAGVLTPDTQLVLTNAIYFNAAWSMPFKKELTADGTFTKLDNSTETVKMMKGVEGYMPYYDGGDYQALALQYDGNELSMLVILPKSGKFKDVEASLDAAALDTLVKNLSYDNVEVQFPQFEVTAEFKLNTALIALGMPTAFSDSADFSGMNGIGGLKIDAVLHKAFVKVNEAGTEAAAATAVIVGPTSVPPPAKMIVVDRPFIFLIRDHATNATLFVGRVLEP